MKKIISKYSVAEMIKFYHVREIKWVSLFSFFSPLWRLILSLICQNNHSS